MATRCMAKVVWKVIGLNPGLLSGAVGGAARPARRARRRTVGSSIGDGSSWISRIRGGGRYQWVMEFVVIYPIQSEYYIQSYLIQSEAI